MPAAGAGGRRLDIFSLIYDFSLLAPSLWDSARYRLKYCLKGPLNPKTANQFHLRRYMNDCTGFTKKLPFVLSKDDAQTVFRMKVLHVSNTDSDCYTFSLNGFYLGGKADFQTSSTSNGSLIT